MTRRLYGLFFAVTTVALAAGFQSAVAQPEIATYKNPQYRFSFNYPSSWAETATRTSTGVVKITSDNGYGEESCSVVIDRSPRLKDVPTKKAIQSTTADSLARQLEKGGMKNVRVESSGLTNVVARDAFYTVMSYDIPMVGTVFPMKVLMVITTKSDLVYTFSCGTHNPGSFKQRYPLFQFITGTLAIE